MLKVIITIVSQTVIYHVFSLYRSVSLLVHVNKTGFSISLCNLH